MLVEVLDADWSNAASVMIKHEIHSSTELHSINHYLIFWLTNAY